MAYYMRNKPFIKGDVAMAVIYPHFLSETLKTHDNLQNGIPYPFFDPGCVGYEALRAVLVDKRNRSEVLEKYGLSDHAYRNHLLKFSRHGVCGLIGSNSRNLTEDFPVNVERMVFVLKQAKPNIPATRMVVILKGFGHETDLDRMRHLYASYGWAAGTKPYTDIDFFSLNLKVSGLVQRRRSSFRGRGFWRKGDRPQVLLEVFRTLGERGITRRYDGSLVSFEQHKKNFLSLGLLGLIDRARPSFRNSKLGFREEGLAVWSKIRKPERTEDYYLRILKSKRIQVDRSCISKIFKKWRVSEFQSRFRGDLERLNGDEYEEADYNGTVEELPAKVTPAKMDLGFINLLKPLERATIPLANPGMFLILPYLDRLKIFEKTSSLLDPHPEKSYSWFSLLLLNLGRIFGGTGSISKACRIHEPSLPLLSGLISVPCKDSVLNGLAAIGEKELFQLRRYLTRTACRNELIEGKKIAFDFHMRDFTNEDSELKNIGKGPSPARHICCPGFRPHLAWDVVTGAPISLEFRNGRARATTTVKRFIRELIQDLLGDQSVEHVYLDSEYTAEHVWKFVVDPDEGLGADLTMCVKQNRRVKKIIAAFLETNPEWLYHDEDHTYADGTFQIPIADTGRNLNCVLKRQESNGRLRCFGSTMQSLDSGGILREYRHRWTVENGIKDLVGNYYFDNIPGIDPHRINVHYFIVTLARLIYEMFCRDYEDAWNNDRTKKSIGTLRPEFIAGVNGALSRTGDTVVVKWNDAFPKDKHQSLEKLFLKLNEEGGNGMPFWGNLKLRFEIVPPRPEHFRNRMKKRIVDF